MSHGLSYTSTLPTAASQPQVALKPDCGLSRGSPLRVAFRLLGRAPSKGGGGPGGGWVGPPPPPPPPGGAECLEAPKKIFGLN